VLTIAADGAPALGALGACVAVRGRRCRHQAGTALECSSGLIRHNRQARQE